MLPLLQYCKKYLMTKNEGAKTGLGHNHANLGYLMGYKLRKHNRFIGRTTNKSKAFKIKRTKLTARKQLQ
jgi:hypothetical protein